MFNFFLSFSYAFQRGDCSRGTDCKFDHIAASGDVPLPVMRAVSAVRGGEGPCFAWQQGQCNRGTACKFSHDVRDLAAANMGGGRGGHSAPPSAGVCYAWKEGTYGLTSQCNAMQVKFNTRHFFLTKTHPAIRPRWNKRNKEITYNEIQESSKSHYKFKL